MNQFLISSVWQHPLDALLIALSYHHIDIQIPFPLVSLLGQDMSRMRMAAFDLAGRGDAKSLGRSLMGF